MASTTLSDAKLKELEELAVGWGRLLAVEAFPDAPGMDVTLADMEEIAARPISPFSPRCRSAPLATAT